MRIPGFSLLARSDRFYPLPPFFWFSCCIVRSSVYLLAMPTLPFLLSLLNTTVENTLPATRRKLLPKELLNGAWTAAITSFSDPSLRGERRCFSYSPLSLLRLSVCSLHSPCHCCRNQTQEHGGWRLLHSLLHAFSPLLSSDSKLNTVSVLESCTAVCLR